MDLSAFFLAPNPSPSSGEYTSEQIGGIIRESALWEEAEIILLGNTSELGSKNTSGTTDAADAIRHQLYQLTLPQQELRIADLGNLKEKDSLEAYSEMLAYVLKILLEKGKRVLILGGNSSITYGQYLAYEDLGKSIEYVHIATDFDLEDSDHALHERSVNHKIFLHKPNILFNYSNLGYQRYFVRESEIETLQSLHFSALRYGEIYQKPTIAEPYLRTADMLNLDISAIRSSEAIASRNNSPGGFSVMEICQLARYAGLAYSLNSMSLTGYIPQKDVQQQTAKLGAMLCWYFLEGHVNRTDDFPREDRKNLRKYTVRLQASIESIDFYKHRSTGRWWMEVPYDHVNGKKFKHSRLIACSAEDYEFAKGDDIPERWWSAYNKLEK